MNWNGGQRADVRAWTCMYCRNLDSLRWNITNRMTEINTRKELLSVSLNPSGIRYYWRKRASRKGFTAGTDYGTDGPYFIWKPFFFHFLRPIISIVRNTVEMEEFDGNCVSLTKLDEMQWIPLLSMPIKWDVRHSKHYLERKGIGTSRNGPRSG